jgi:hypothetical protein
MNLHQIRANACLSTLSSAKTDVESYRVRISDRLCTVDWILRQETEDLDIKNPNTESARKMMKKAIQISQLDARVVSWGLG